MSFDWSVPAALVVGALLATSGATLQSVLRNPLAEPYMLGLVGGASLFVAAAMHFGLVALSVFALPLASFLGSCFSLALVCAVAGFARRRRHVFCGLGAGEMRSPESTLILAGFVVGSITCSLQMLILSYAEPGTFANLSKWLFGDLRSARAQSVAAGAAALAATLAVLLAQAKRLNLLELGADEASCLGMDVGRTAFVCLAAASFATAAAVALAGAVGFVGLVVPHAVRRLAPYDHRVQLPLCAAAGGAVLLAAELVGRRLPGSLSAGVVCALVGGPFFLWLLARPQER